MGRGYLKKEKMLEKSLSAFPGGRGERWVRV